MQGKTERRSFRLFHPAGRFFYLSLIGDNYAAAAGGGEGGWISCTERISAPFALMPVALPFANAMKKSRARGPWIRT
jgi:hypothetical protein